MGTLWGGAALLLVALFMLVGFLRSSVDPSAPATIVAVIIAVALPAAAGTALLAKHFGAGRRIAARREELRRQTVEAEVLRMAARHGGKLTVVEIMTDLAVPQDIAREALDRLMARDLADVEITESGVLVYAFRDVQHIAEKARSRGILDA